MLEANYSSKRPTRRWILATAAVHSKREIVASVIIGSPFEHKLSDNRYKFLKN